MKPLKEMNPITLQERIYYDLSEKIKNGEYKPGDRIPTEMQLSQMYDVSRVTVRGALKQLVDEGILIKKHGKGTFVKNTTYVESGSASLNFTEACLRQNAVPSTQIISCRLCPGDKEILKSLKTNSSALIEIVRLRLINGMPCIVELDYFPEEYRFLLNENLEDRSLIQTITERTGIIPCYFEDQFRVRYAKKEFAQLLNCPTATPLLEVTQKRFSQKGEIVYINKQNILTSNYVYVIQSPIKM